MYRLTSAAVTGLLIVAAGATQGVHAQSIISAHSGVVHYSEGRVLIGDAAIDPKPGQFVSLKQDEVLRTEEGRAEILLTPGVFLRIGESSSIRMVSNRLTDTRIEVLGGSAVVEVADMPRDNAVTLLYKDRTMSLRKNGIYRVDTEPARFGVYSGEAVVTAGSDQLTLKGGKETPLDGVLVASRFNTKEGGAGDDALYRWSKRRDGYDSMANVYAARSVLDSGANVFTNGWAWNPYFGMFGFVPRSGIFYSPFGYNYFSPFDVFQAYSFYPSYFYGYGFIPSYGYGYGYTPPMTGGSGGSVGSGGSSSGGTAAKRPIGSPRIPAPIHNGNVLAGSTRGGYAGGVRPSFGGGGRAAYGGGGSSSYGSSHASPVGSSMHTGSLGGGSISAAPSASSAGGHSSHR